jgi:arylsulfatase A-like enzyme
MQTLLITVDSLRADRLGQYGYHRDTMPVLDDLTAEGARFEQAFSNGPYTRVSIPSFHTSRYLAYGDVGAFPTMASVLSNAGVQTASIGTCTGIRLMKGEFRYDEMIDLGHDEMDDATSTGQRMALGINEAAASVSEWLQARGMTGVYRVLKQPYDAVVGESRPERVKPYTSAERVTDRAIEWLDAANGDFFLWLHYMEAHRPYGVHDPDPVYADGPADRDALINLMRRAGTDPESLSVAEHTEMNDRYDSNLRYCSRHLERLFDALRERDLWADSNIVLTSDHGEEFGEHGSYFHRNYPYDELIHVPLLVKRAEETTRGRGGSTVAEQRELLDLAPTVCGFHDVDTPDSFLGTPLFEGEERTVVALGQPGMDDPAVAVRHDDWKYIHTETATQLYNLSADPKECENVADLEPGTASRLHRLVPSYLFGRDTKSPRPPEDDVDREQLAALGYMELREGSEEEATSGTGTEPDTK